MEGVEGGGKEGGEGERREKLSTCFCLEELDLWAGHGVVPEPAAAVSSTGEEEASLGVDRQVPDSITVAL